MCACVFKGDRSGLHIGDIVQQNVKEFFLDRMSGEPTEGRGHG